MCNHCTGPLLCKQSLLLINTNRDKAPWQDLCNQPWLQQQHSPEIIQSLAGSINTPVSKRCHCKSCWSLSKHGTPGLFDEHSPCSAAAAHTGNQHPIREPWIAGAGLGALGWVNCSDQIKQETSEWWEKGQEAPWQQSQPPANLVPSQPSPPGSPTAQQRNSHHAKNSTLQCKRFPSTSSAVNLKNRFYF